jgi:hypothetical protein
MPLRVEQYKEASIQKETREQWIMQAIMDRYSTSAIVVMLGVVMLEVFSALWANEWLRP